MPVLTFYCDSCKKSVKELCYGKVSVIQCETCDKPMVRKQKVPAMIVKETIDNGVQTRRVEQLADSNRLIEERLADHDKFLKGEK